MQVLLPIMMLYAAVGLILSLVVHVLSFFGVAVGGQTLFTALHIGIFPLWLPVVLISQKIFPYTGRNYSYSGRGEFWNVMLSGCPAWMRYMTRGFFYYAIANFIIFIFIVAAKQQGSGPPSPTVWHGFSGHWMAFYSAGLAVSTSAYRRGIANLTPRCPNGHSVGIGDAFCPSCGVRLNTSSGQAAA